METTEIKLSEIKTNGNIRTSWDTAKDKELSDSIGKHGLLSPLVVRRVADKHQFTYMLVAGHRRLKALQKLKHEKVRVQVVDVDDDGALEVQITENLQRQDLTPVEEARAFKSLLKLRPEYSTEELARQADKSVAYVTRALSLLELSDKTLGLIESGELTAEHGHQIARVAGKQRETIERFATTKSQWSKVFPRLDELKREIERAVEKDLTKAVFPKDVAGYGGTVTPACVACPSNTGNQNVLFDGAEKGSCTNGGCYAKRTAFWYKEFQAKAAAKLEKLKFLGFVSATPYSSMGTIKGFPVIDAKKRKDAIAKTPEKFGFAIVRPSRWDDRKTPEIAIVSLNKSEKPEPLKANYEKQNFIEQNVRFGVIVAAWKKARALTKAEFVETVLANADNEIVEAIKKFEGSMMDDERFLGHLEPEELLWVLFLGIPGLYQMDPKEWNRFGIDSAKVMTESKKEAEQKWAAQAKAN